MNRRLTFACTAIAALWLSGCSTFDSSYRYLPRPAAVRVTEQPASEAEPVQVLASVVGLRTKHAKVHPETVQVRMRLENTSNVPVRFDPTQPGGLELYSANLQRFAEPALEPSGPIVLAPGQTATVQAYFPARGMEEGDLDGLNLRWRIFVGEQSLSRSNTFDRRPLYPYYDYYDPWYPRFTFSSGYYGWY